MPFRVGEVITVVLHSSFPPEYELVFPKHLELVVHWGIAKNPGDELVVVTL